jgi:glycosyltransferase involved in cell wall biosynthesis
MKLEIPNHCAIVIPFYKGGEAARVFLNELSSSLELSQVTQVLIVDDGSGEDADFLENLPFRLERKKENQGKAETLKTGLSILQKEGFLMAISMDCDGQHGLKDLPSFFKEIQCVGLNFSGVLLGARSLSPKEMPFARVLSNRITTEVLSKLAGQKLYDSQCGYRAYSLDLLDVCMGVKSQGFQWESEVLVRLSWQGVKVKRVPIETIYGDEVSQISPWEDTFLFVKLWLRLIKEKLLR